ncbi:MAG: nascent polypeptide-associated complex protein [Candidatus Aenigmatarchaeota archaeon]|nr:MAG: nascent polypeptide-associated complex protein [Candidatus Aenigmarchaeota archaeon]RLJ08417.1 MAG: nascent polypeptide-associated complex protein [Candidatus Aenigmarchaeota archaeon]RLJ09074.1 MAG: nascent polypeptide-associated complex protein [Candidatus Aenigmarchaeota archaeon]
MKINPRQIEKLAKQLGMQMETVDAEEVIIKLRNGNEIRISEPQVSKVNVMGQETFQITGNVKETGFSQEDIQTIIDQTGVNEEEAKKALEETRDLAEAILRLKKH